MKGVDVSGHRGSGLSVGKWSPVPQQLSWTLKSFLPRAPATEGAFLSSTHLLNLQYLMGMSFLPSFPCLVSDTPPFTACLIIYDLARRARKKEEFVLGSLQKVRLN